MVSVAVAKKRRGFDPGTFLATIGEGRKSLTVSKKHGDLHAGGKRLTLSSISRKAKVGSPSFLRRGRKPRSAY